jgi:hypothetical protein
MQYNETFWNEIKKKRRLRRILVLETKPNPYGVEQFPGSDRDASLT